MTLALQVRAPVWWRRHDSRDVGRSGIVGTSWRRRCHPIEADRRVLHL